MTVLAAAVICALTITGDVKTYPSKNIDYSQIKTYQWLPVKILTNKGVVENEPTISPLVQKAVNEQLVKKGLAEAPHGADIEVVTWITTASIPQLEALIFSPADGTTWGTSPIATVGRYNREGTLVINLVDPRVNKSVWLGMATKALGKSSQNERAINKAAQELFKRYPK